VLNANVCHYIYFALLDDSLQITDMFVLNLGFYQTLILVVISILAYQIHLYKLRTFDKVETLITLTS